jgi:hypothetical protein
MKRRSWILVIFITLSILVPAVCAAVISLVYQAAQTAAATNAYSGAVADLANDSAYDYTADIDMETDGYSGLWVWIEHDSSGTTDDLTFGYFSSPDGTDFDDIELYTMRIDSDGSDDQIGFYFQSPPPHGRIGLKTTGTTDTFDYRIRYRGVRGNAS